MGFGIMTIAVELKDVTINYNNKPAIVGISGSFARGSLTAITGPNGAGKSTLLKAIAGIIKSDDGAIRVNVAHEKIAYLPQVSEIQRDFPISVLHLVTTGYFQEFGGYSAINSQMKKHALEVLSEVGLVGFENNDIASLSLGQFQRALFARLIIQDASLILLDEPFAAIDFETTSKLTDIIKKWHREQRTIICVLHDLEQIINNFHECLILNRKCADWGKSEIVLQKYHPKLLNCC